MPRVIKRYENRKLYDTEAKAYVSLEELAELIRKGEQISVVENATGEDITVQTLAKIISEMGSRPNSSSPTDILHDVVRWGGQVFESGRLWKDQQFDRVVLASLERIGVLEEIRGSVAALAERVGRLEGTGSSDRETQAEPAAAAGQSG